MLNKRCNTYSKPVFEAFNGGYMHYCGHTLQNQALRLATKGLSAIDMGGRERNS